jgi:hypothetical protein
VQSLPGKEKSAQRQKESVMILSGRSAVSVQFCAINPIPYIGTGTFSKKDSANEQNPGLKVSIPCTGLTLTMKRTLIPGLSGICNVFMRAILRYLAKEEAAGFLL